MDQDLLHIQESKESGCAFMQRNINYYICIGRPTTQTYTMFCQATESCAQMTMLEGQLSIGLGCVPLGSLAAKTAQAGP